MIRRESGGIWKCTIPLSAQRTCVSGVGPGLIYSHLHSFGAHVLADLLFSRPPRPPRDFYDPRL